MSSSERQPPTYNVTVRLTQEQVRKLDAVVARRIASGKRTSRQKLMTHAVERFIADAERER